MTATIQAKTLTDFSIVQDSLMIETILLGLFGLITLALAVIFLTYYYYKRKFLRQLRTHANYSTTNSDVDNEIQFVYSDVDNENLIKLRKDYDLEAVAGKGLELSRIINLMKWTHNLAYRTPNPAMPDEMTSLRLLEEIKTQGKKISCWMFATILNDVYLSMGFKSRIVHLKSPKEPPGESHIVNAVYSATFQKWLFMDADFGAYFRDEDDTILSIPEIRQRLIDSQPLIVNSEAGPRTAKLAAVARYLGEKTYKMYISKNIFRYNCPMYAEFGYEAKKSGRVYIELIPEGYGKVGFENPHTTERRTILFTQNRELFWKKP
ncbi:MAG: hypothetical protein ACXADX_02120 [Candidatus Hodarchaeales archaeon]